MRALAKIAKISVSLIITQLKVDQHYSIVISLLRYRLSFSLLQSAIMCAGNPQRDIDFAVAASEGRLSLTD